MSVLQNVDIVKFDGETRVNSPQVLGQESDSPVTCFPQVTPDPSTRHASASTGSVRPLLLINKISHNRLALWSPSVCKYTKGKGRTNTLRILPVFATHTHCSLDPPVTRAECGAVERRQRWGGSGCFLTAVTRCDTPWSR